MPGIISGYQNNHLFDAKAHQASGAWDKTSISGGKYTGYNNSAPNLTLVSKGFYIVSYGMLNTGTYGCDRS